MNNLNQAFLFDNHLIFYGFWYTREYIIKISVHYQNGIVAFLPIFSFQNYTPTDVHDNGEGSFSG